MGRKYRQTGYQDSGDERRDERKQERRGQQPRRSLDGPRSPRMPGFQELMRCAMCGSIIPSSMDITFDSQCPKCGGDLRTCKNCRNFDTSARFECTQPIPKRIMAKHARNECEFFEPRRSIERETTSPSGSNGSPKTPKDARSAFDDLFR